MGQTFSAFCKSTIYYLSRAYSHVRLFQLGQIARTMWRSLLRGHAKSRAFRMIWNTQLLRGILRGWQIRIERERAPARRDPSSGCLIIIIIARLSHPAKSAPRNERNLHLAAKYISITWRPLNAFLACCSPPWPNWCTRVPSSYMARLACVCVCVSWEGKTMWSHKKGQSIGRNLGLDAAHSGRGPAVN